MTYLYLTKIQDDYFLTYFMEFHDFMESSTNHGIICKLELAYEELLPKYSSLYSKTADQAIGLEVLLKGCRAFRKEEINWRINEALSEYLAAIDPLERETSAIELKEAESYINSKESYSSNILKSLALANSLKVDDIARLIISKARTHEQKLISFKCQRDHLTSKLEYIDTLEGFEKFNLKAEIESYLKDSLKKNFIKEDIDFSVDDKIKEDKVKEAIESVLSKNNKKKASKIQLSEKPQDPQPLLETSVKEIQSN